MSPEFSPGQQPPLPCRLLLHFMLLGKTNAPLSFTLNSWWSTIKFPESLTSSSFFNSPLTDKNVLVSTLRSVSKVNLPAIKVSAPNHPLIRPLFHNLIGEHGRNASFLTVALHLQLPQNLILTLLNYYSLVSDFHFHLFKLVDQMNLEYDHQTQCTKYLVDLQNLILVAIQRERLKEND